MYLYRTNLGISFIEKFTKKFAKILKPLQYLIIASGYLLMFSMIWFLVKFSWVYITSPFMARELKVPILIPLIPYLPELFKIDFLPSFPFTYWIIIIALIAIPHEFAHGIFSRLNKIKVHSTGFGFLGPFLAAFVEPDEKQMAKSKKVPQLAILASGTFANVLTAIVLGIIMALFFVSSFVPAGVYFNTYSYSALNVSQIVIPGFSQNDTFVSVMYNNETYFTTPTALQTTLDNNLSYLPAYDDSPAFRVKLAGAITKVDSVSVSSVEQLDFELKSHSPGENITITTQIQENVRDSLGTEKNFSVVLSEGEGQTSLGIGIIPPQTSGILGSVYSLISKIKTPWIYYHSLLGSFGWFIYNLLWWSVLICISVALVNMIPVGIFDGGRFFYLSVWGLTGSEKVGKFAFKASTWILLLLILALMLKWAFAFA